VKTTRYELLFTGNQHTLTDYLTTSYNPTLHKVTTVQTLKRRAQIASNSHNSLTNKIKHLNTVSIKNNYSADFVDCNTYTIPKDSSNNLYTTTATIPYIRGTSKTIARLLWLHDVQVAHKPMFTLQRFLTNVKGKDKPEDKPGAVYEIKCSDCQATYIGETGRNLITWANEHKWATKKGDLNNIITKHHLKTSHIIDWNSATWLTYSTDHYR